MSVEHINIESSAVEIRKGLLDKSEVSNFRILLITTVLFGGFVLAEVIGALVSVQV